MEEEDCLVWKEVSTAPLAVDPSTGINMICDTEGGHVIQSTRAYLPVSVPAHPSPPLLHLLGSRKGPFQQRSRIFE